MKGVLGKKVGMSRMICSETGRFVPVTLVQVPAMEVLQVKTQEKEGYDAVVLGAFPKKKGGFEYVKELSLEGAFEKGQKVDVSILEGTEQICVTGTSRGRGFSGVIKRHGFARGPETHGSHHHREPGSVGMCAKPGRVLKGKKLPGQYGNKQVTTRGLKALVIDKEAGVVAISGAIPGAKKGLVIVKSY
jgi:large subunit ribosomal protein L3